MKFKFRQLTGRTNWQAVSATVAEKQRIQPYDADGDDRSVAVDYAAAAVSTPRTVTAYEDEAEAEAIVALLDSGKLTPRDLVLEGDHWICFADSRRFEEASARVEGRARKKRLIAIAALVGVD